MTNPNPFPKRFLKNLLTMRAEWDESREGLEEKHMVMRVYHSYGRKLLHYTITHKKGKLYATFSWHWSSHVCTINFSIGKVMHVCLGGVVFSIQKLTHRASLVFWIACSWKPFNVTNSFVCVAWYRHCHWCAILSCPLVLVTRSLICGSWRPWNS